MIELEFEVRGLVEAQLAVWRAGFAPVNENVGGR